MSNPIKFRKERPTIDARDLARMGGNDGEIAQALVEQRAKLAELAELAADPQSDGLEEAGEALIKAEEAGLRTLMKVADFQQDALYSAKRMTDAQANAAASALPTSGWGGPPDLEAARAGARRAVVTSAQRASAEDAYARYTNEAAKAALAFAAAFVDFADAFDAAYVNWCSPSALRDDFSIESLHRSAALESELRTHKRPMASAIKLFQGLLKHSTHDLEKIALFIGAARSVALEVRDMAPPKLAARYGNDRSASDDERGLAVRLLAQFDEYKRTTRPPSIDIAYGLLTETRELGRIIFGAEIRYAVRSEFDIRGLPFTGEQVDAARPWQLSKNWFTRYLPPSLSSPLPGWSPIIMRTSLGGVIRQPK